MMVPQFPQRLARRVLLAACSTSLQFLSAPFQPTPVSAEFTTPLMQQDFQGAEIRGFDDQGHSLTLQIRNIEIDPKDPEHETDLYTVFYQDNHQNWQNLCHADARYEAKAIALQGSWNPKGTHQAGQNLVTFSCLNGALAKCIRFGYKPWKTVNGQSLKDYHQACVRMVRADYCGDGTAHTKDGTPINIYDRLGIQKPDPAANMSFEAGWGIDGATWINHTRYPEDLAYVQRVCPARLATSKEQNPSLETDQAQPHFSNALVFNDSIIKPYGEVDFNSAR